MNTLIQHAKLAIRMNNNGINREFIKKFPIEEIIDCCNRIEQNKILNDEYKDIIPEMLKHLRYSQIEKLSKKYDGFEFKNINIELPKGTVITNIPEEFIQQIENWINNLLRPMFGYKSSLEMAKNVS